MEKEEIELLKDMRPEDVLEYLYEISDSWEKASKPIEKAKEDMRTMIRELKEQKFSKMDPYFNLIMQS